MPNWAENDGKIAPQQEAFKLTVCMEAASEACWWGRTLIARGKEDEDGGYRNMLTSKYLGAEEKGRGLTWICTVPQRQEQGANTTRGFIHQFCAICRYPCGGEANPHKLWWTLTHDWQASKLASSERFFPPSETLYWLMFNPKNRMPRGVNGPV